MLWFVKLSCAFCVGWNVPPVCIWMPKRQTASKQVLYFVVSPELQVSGTAFDLLACFQFWLSAFVCALHYNPEIKYTSKQLKLNKIKCVGPVTENTCWLNISTSVFLSLALQPISLSSSIWMSSAIHSELLCKSAPIQPSQCYCGDTCCAEWNLW